jgi:hypothetical protein
LVLVSMVLVLVSMVLVLVLVSMVSRRVAPHASACAAAAAVALSWRCAPAAWLVGGVGGVATAADGAARAWWRDGARLVSRVL